MTRLTPLFLILSIIMIPQVLATFTNEWGEMNDDSWRRAFVNDQNGLWNSTGAVTTKVTGSTYQPLLIHASNTDHLELITSYSNDIEIWDVHTGSFVMQDELTFLYPQVSTFSRLEDGYDTDDYTEFVVIMGNSTETNISVIEFNGTNINIECSIINETMITGIACKNISSIPTCFYGSDAGEIIEITMNNCSATMVDVAAWDLFTMANPQSYRKSHNPIIADLDRDGADEVIFMCDAEDADNADGLCVYDTNTNDLDTGFSANGQQEFAPVVGTATHMNGFSYWNLGANSALFDECLNDCHIAFPFHGTWYGLLLGHSALYNLCVGVCAHAYEFNTYGGGYGEIILSWRETGSAMGERQYLSAISNTGSTLWTTTTHSDGADPSAPYSSSPVIMGTGQAWSGSDDQICVVIEVDSATDFNLIKCVNDAGTIVFTQSFTNDNTIWAQEYNPAPVAARMISQDKMSLITGNNIFELNFNTNTSTRINISTALNPLYYPVLGDVDNNNALDVCGCLAGGCFCAFNNRNNEPPEINNSYEYGGYGYDLDVKQPICINTTVVFTAQECGGSLTCNYDNDLDVDLERISSNCGMNTYNHTTSSTTDNLANGTYAGSRPVFNCYFSNAETYSIRLYLEDNANVADRTAYNTQSFSIHVINGEPGVTCNIITDVLPGDEEAANAGTDAAVPDVFETVWDEFGFVSQTSKTIIGLAAVIGVMVAVAGLTLAPFAIVGAGIITLIIVTFMGLVSAYILILTLVGLGLIFLVLGKVTPSNGGG